MERTAVDGLGERGGLEELAVELAEIGRAAGLDAVGVASAAPFDEVRRTLEERRGAGLSAGMAFTYRNPARSTDPGRALAGARALVVGARGYRRADPPDSAARLSRVLPRGTHGDALVSVTSRAGEPEGSVGVVARYSWEDHYAPLRAALDAVAEALRARGWRAKVLVDDNALVDRAAAHRAGIAWWGKNANLLLPGRGSWFVLGSVVTDAPLPADDAPLGDGCGGCTRCLESCPTGALVEPGVLDARRCLAWLLEAPGPFPREHRVALAGRIYGCDECQEVCPPNRAADRRNPPPPASAGAEPWVDLVDILNESDETLLSRFARWYVPSREARYIRRNALVALGNVGDGADPRVREALDRALSDDDPLVRGHAVWAARRLGLDALVAAVVEEETDADVLAEVGAPLTPR